MELSDRVTVAVDVMTAELGPQVAAYGALDAVREFGINVILVGKGSSMAYFVEQYCRDNRLDFGSFYRHADIEDFYSDIITMEDGPEEWIKKEKSSIKTCIDLVLSGRAQSLVSAGNSGATGALCKRDFGLVPGLRYTKIACKTPTKYRDKYVLISDVGLKVDYDLRDFVECAIMQAVYLRHCLGVAHPRIGILNIGEEPRKGTKLMKAAAPLFSPIAENTGLFEFVGNKEPKHLTNFEADGIVCGADLGNVTIKAGAAYTKLVGNVLEQSLRDHIILAALAAPFLALASPFLYVLYRDFRARMTPSSYGGAPILGTMKGKGVITHGSSDARGIKMATKVAADYARMADFSKVLEETLRDPALEKILKPHDISLFKKNSKT